MKLALLCGGPSPERGISLNSARSVMDHLGSEEIEILPVYFDQNRNAYRISCSQLYSNTPSDFDFKLGTSAKALSPKALVRFLKGVDLAFPAMHGAFGEDGQIQRFLEKNGIPFVGSPSDACKQAFDKYEANEFVKSVGFPSIPTAVLKIHKTDHREVLERFFREHSVTRAVVKPATGGSSIGVYSVDSVDEALARSKELFGRRLDTRVVVEPFCEGTEFTVILLENRFGMPVAILPTEIEIDYRKGQIFDTRKKYLATRQVTYHCPPRFGNEIVERIQIQAEQLFKALGMRDFARFDGWLMKDGTLRFSDFNPISGMEQNSFLFMQAAQIGMSHKDVLQYVVRNACRRYKIGLQIPDCRFQKNLNPQSAIPNPQSPIRNRQSVNVLFGGSSSERQVSVMSGTNVWLKLRKSEKFAPKPYLLDIEHNVWRLPYSMTLNHTVEEIAEMCRNAAQNEQRLNRLKLRVHDKLAVAEDEISEPPFLPEKMTLAEFIRRSSFVFIGLHGGIGEDGTLQRMLEEARVPFNGSGSEASRLCMDKYRTGEALKGLEKEGIRSSPKVLAELGLFQDFEDSDFKNYWKNLACDLVSPSIIVKPRGDGCSSGIARLFSWKDLKSYVQFARDGVDHIPENVLTDQHGLIQMPSERMDAVMFEPFVVTDRIRVVGKELKWETKTDWIEITMGVIEEGGKVRAMSPSLTVASGNVLTLEEKFQGGTGVNITPPPTPFVKPKAIARAKERMEKVARALGIRGYARIDAFMHVRSGELIVIEANTAPGLTPSTVIYHQALAETPSLYPTEFLERIVESGIRAHALDGGSEKKIQLTRLRLQPLIRKTTRV
jgi:D-alanine--D-alanine ligase